MIVRDFGVFASPSKDALEVGRSPVEVEAKVTLDFRKFKDDFGAVEPGAIVVGHVVGNYLVDEPGDEVAIPYIPPGFNRPEFMRIENGLIWGDGFHWFDNVEFRIPSLNAPGPGQWHFLLEHLHGGRAPKPVGGAELWHILFGGKFVEAEDVITAFGSTPEAVEHIKRQAVKTVSNAIKNAPPRVANAALRRLAESEVLAEFLAADFGPLALEIFSGALRAEIYAVDLAGLPVLVDRIFDGLGLKYEREAS